MNTMKNIALNNVGTNKNRKFRVLDPMAFINKFLKDVKVERVDLSNLRTIVLESADQDEALSEFKNEHLYWSQNQTIVGGCHITHHTKTKETKINFEYFEENSFSEIELTALLKENIKSIFERYTIDRIIFTDDENSSGYISELFLKNFNPYPIGYVHLNKGKYVLTKNRFLGKKERFYKSGYLHYIGK